MYKRTYVFYEPVTDTEFTIIAYSTKIAIEYAEDYINDLMWKLDRDDLYIESYEEITE